MLIKDSFDGVLVTNKSMLSGKINTISIPLDHTTFERSLIAWRAGVLIQDAFPTLTDDQREFLVSGITYNEWETELGEDPREEPQTYEDRR